MIISLMGYMGSGKSHISKILSDSIHFKHADLDKEISKGLKMTVSEIFDKRGEIFFRKKEREVLEEILATEENLVLSLGGGTPAYYNNIEVINQYSVSVFLRAGIPTLAERLSKQKDKRPMISQIAEENLSEYIAKHLFERNQFYAKAQYMVDTDGKKPEEIAQEIKERLYL